MQIKKEVLEKSKIDKSCATTVINFNGISLVIDQRDSFEEAMEKITSAKVIIAYDGPDGEKEQQFKILPYRYKPGSQNQSIPNTIDVKVSLDGDESVEEMYEKTMIEVSNELDRLVARKNALIEKVKAIMEEEAGVYYEEEKRLILSVHTLSGDPDIVFYKDTEEIMIDFTSDIAMYEDEDLRYHFEIIKKINEAKKNM